MTIMKKYLVIILLLTSCGYTKIPLKGSYQTEPYYQTSSNSVNVVWDKLVDLFAKNGLSIKVIDRTSGLIVSDKYKLTWTKEDKSGKLVNDKAFVVIPKLFNKGSNMYYEPYEVTGEWNVRIKDDGKGGTTINVNLVNIKDVNPSLRGGFTETVSGAISTGVFERYIYEQIK